MSKPELALDSAGRTTLTADQTSAFGGADGALSAALRQAATRAADGPVRPVSLTIDYANSLDDAPLTLTTHIDRRTRSIVFAQASMEQNGATRLTATGVFAIL